MLSSICASCKRVSGDGGSLVRRARVVMCSGASGFVAAAACTKVEGEKAFQLGPGS